MPDLYLALKLVHILSATILFGTGLGTAFFMWRADRSGNVAAIAVTARHVVLADWLFTTPAVVVQPVSGVWLAWHVGYGFDDAWLMLSVGLFILAGACWLPVVWLQLRMCKSAAAAHAAGTALPDDYRRAMRLWFALGWPAFAAVIAIFVLMIFRPAL